MEPSKEILVIIRKIIRSLNLESKRIDREYGITIPQMFCLNHLHTCENFQCSHKELKKVLSLNSSTITGIVDRLEKKGLVARLPSKVDKRVTQVGLTSRGEKLIKATPTLMQDRLASGLADQSPEQISELTTSLKKIASMLGIEDLDASPLLTTEEPIFENNLKKEPNN